MSSKILKESPSQLGYQPTMMHGQYRKDLAKFAKEEAVRLRLEQEKLRRWEAKQIKNRRVIRLHSGSSESLLHKLKGGIKWCRSLAHSSLGDDWLFLALLGIVMALLSFGIDYCISFFQRGQVYVFHKLDGHPFPQYLLWIGYPTILIVFSTAFTHYVEPNAKGSGIPEMKTILRGIVLKEYLSLRTLVSKVVGLATSLGTSLPLGKVGPFVHIANIVATVLNRWIGKLTGGYSYVNEYQNYDMLAAACAVGVACTFSAPIGGLLFSIEVTTSHFAVRNYWRGFFAATCAALMFRLLAVWDEKEETIVALYKTTFRMEFAYDVTEVFVYAMIGVVGGFGGALFIFLHRQLVEFNRRDTILKTILSKNRYLYPGIITIVISTFTFPLGFGQFMAGELTPGQVLTSFFSNETWTGATQEEIENAEFASYWFGNHGNVFLSIGLYVFMTFWMTLVSITMPVACGIFMPVFIVGASLGRLVGEAMAAWFPDGFMQGDQLLKVVPGGYAVVGAAALSGSVTHTVSTSVVVAEMTGQITHILPIMVAVLIANAISLLIQPSIFDSIIQIKKLPYLPDIPTGEARTHNIFAEEIMTTDIDYVTYDYTYMDLKYLLSQTYHSTYPLVDSLDGMLFVGVISRSELEYLVDSKIGRVARIEEANKRLNEDSENGRDDDDDEKMDEDIDIVYEAKPRKTKSTVSDIPASFARVDVDLNATEQLDWEREQLSEKVNFAPCQIDPSPLHVVGETSLHKVHNLFSLLGINKAYVIDMGRLVGIVALDEVRQAIVGSGIYDSDSEDDDEDDAFYDTYDEEERDVNEEGSAQEMKEITNEEPSEKTQ
ncbi:chloride channel protein 2-like [Glandiceps talaboti]